MIGAPFLPVWDPFNYEWILTDRDGDEVSRHRTLADAEEAAIEAEVFG